jgi:lipoprotein-anchoring transpeptidase ErfK/SrfK
MQTTTVPPAGCRCLLPRAVLGHRPLGRQLLSGLAAAAVLLGIIANSATGANLGSRVPATQQLAVLLTPHGAHLRPERGSPQVALVAARRPITGEQTALPVIGRRTATNGLRWLLVRLPGRPNGLTGWIALQGTRKLMTTWHLVVELSSRRVSVYDNGHLARRFQAIVGKPSTPTPTGRFFVEETLQMAAGETGGPFALALSARSDALQEFEGGPGQIALHGRDNLGGTLGTAESHGCVRLATESIDWLAARIGPGTPTTILAD